MMPAFSMRSQSVAKWFRYCLAAAALYNLMGAVFFAPPLYFTLGANLGSPQNIAPFMLWVLASWVLIFGIGFAYNAIAARPERLFIAVSATCKLAIAVILFAAWLAKELPLTAAMSGLGDLIVAIAFIIWLLQSPARYRQ